MKWLCSEKGQTSAELGLVLLLVVVAAAVALTGLHAAVNQLWGGFLAQWPT